MRPGIKIIDDTPGTGNEAVKGKTVVVNVRVFLPDGKECACYRYQQQRIDLARREELAGLRYGIEGMREGGHRNFIAGAHLAFGPGGMPGHVPPNTSLRFEVELLEVRDSSAPLPAEYHPGKQLIIIHGGDLSRAVAKWQFGLKEDGVYGVVVHIPIPGLKWRHTKPQYEQSTMDPVRAKALLSWAMAFENQYPGQYLHDVHCEGGDSACYADCQNKTLCMCVMMYERGHCLVNYYITENSAIWNNSELGRFIAEFIAPLLKPAPQHTKPKCLP